MTLSRLEIREISQRILMSIAILLSFLNGGCSNSNLSEVGVVDKHCNSILPRFVSFVQASQGDDEFLKVVRNYYSSAANLAVDKLLTTDNDGLTTFRELYLLFPRHREMVHMESVSCLGAGGDRPLSASILTVLVSSNGFSYIANLTYEFEYGNWFISDIKESEMFKTDLPRTDP